MVAPASRQAISVHGKWRRNVGRRLTGVTVGLLNTDQFGGGGYCDEVPEFVAFEYYNSVIAS